MNEVVSALGTGVLAGLFFGCSATPPAPPPAAPPTPVEAALPAAPTLPPLPAGEGWTRNENVIVSLAGSGEPISLRPFTRLRIDARVDSGLLVTCEVCLPPLAGNVQEQDLIYHPFPPQVARWGSLAEFALAVRNAALATDLEALRPVMADEFTYGFFGPQNPESAFNAWFSDNYSSLARIPSIVDSGFSTRDSIVWSAPPAYDEDLSYRGLRLGFRQRSDGGWEWLYLIAGLVP